MRALVFLFAFLLTSPAWAQGSSGAVGSSDPVPSCGAAPATCNVIGRVQELDALSLASGSVTSAAVIPIGGDVFIDTAGYSSASVQFTSIGTSNAITIEVSDNNSDWTTQPFNNSANAYTATSTNINFGIGNTLASAIVVHGRLISRYLRIRVSSYGSGTVTAVATLRKTPMTNLPVATQGSTTPGISISSSSNPVIAGYQARTSNSVVATAQAINATSTLAGAAIMKPYSIPELDWNYAAASGGIVNTTTAVTMVASAGASTRNYLTGCSFYADALGTATELAIRDGAGGTVLWRIKVPVAGMAMASVWFPSPLKGTAATLMEVVTLTASTTGGVWVNCGGYQAP